MITYSSNIISMMEYSFCPVRDNFQIVDLFNRPVIKENRKKIFDITLNFKKMMDLFILCKFSIFFI